MRPDGERWSGWSPAAGPPQARNGRQRAGLCAKFSQKHGKNHGHFAMPLRQTRDTPRTERCSCISSAIIRKPSSRRLGFGLGLCARATSQRTSSTTRDKAKARGVLLMKKQGRRRRRESQCRLPKSRHSFHQTSRSIGSPGQHDTSARSRRNHRASLICRCTRQTHQLGQNDGAVAKSRSTAPILEVIGPVVASYTGKRHNRKSSATIA